MAEREVKFKHAGPSLAFVEKEIIDKYNMSPPREWQLPDLEHAYDGLDEIGQGPEYFSHIRKESISLIWGGQRRLTPASTIQTSVKALMILMMGKSFCMVPISTRYFQSPPSPLACIGRSMEKTCHTCTLNI